MPFKVSMMVEVDDSETTFDPDETTMETSMLLLSPPTGTGTTRTGSSAPSPSTRTSSITGQTPLQQMDMNVHVPPLEENGSTGTAINLKERQLLDPEVLIDPDETIMLPFTTETPNKESHTSGSSEEEHHFIGTQEKKTNSIDIQETNLHSQHCHNERRNNDNDDDNCSQFFDGDNECSPTKSLDIQMGLGPHEKDYKYSYATIVISLIAKNRQHVRIPSCTSSNVDQRISNLYQCMEDTGVNHTLNKLGIKHRHGSKRLPSHEESSLRDSKVYSSHSENKVAFEPDIIDEDMDTNEVDMQDSESTVGTSNLSKDFSSSMLNENRNNYAGVRSKVHTQTTPGVSNIINETAMQFTQNDPIPYTQGLDSTVSPIELVRSDTQRHAHESLRRPSSFQSPNLRSNNTSSLMSKKRTASTSGKKGTDLHRMRLEDETSFHPIYEDFSQAVNQIMNSPTVMITKNGDGELNPDPSSRDEEDEHDSSFLDSALFSQSPISHRESLSTHVEQSMDLLTLTSNTASKKGSSQQRNGKEIPSHRFENGNDSNSSMDDSVDLKSRQRSRQQGRDHNTYSSFSNKMSSDQQSMSNESSPKRNNHGGGETETSKGLGYSRVRDKGGDGLDSERKQHKDLRRSRRSPSLDSVCSLSSIDNSMDRNGGGYDATSKDSIHKKDSSNRGNSSDPKYDKGLNQNMRLMRQSNTSIDSSNSIGGEILESPCDSFTQRNDSIESVDSTELEEKVRKKKYNDDESIVEDEDYQECSIALKDNSRLYYDPLQCYRAPKWAKTYEHQKEEEIRQKRRLKKKEGEVMQIHRNEKKERLNKPKSIPTMSLVQEPFKEFGSRDSERLEVVSDWLNRRDAVGTKFCSSNPSAAGKAIILSVSARQIVGLGLQVLLHNDVHKISRHNRHVDSDSRKADRDFVPKYGGTLIIGKHKEDLEHWECSLREKTGFTVLNHADLPSTERRRATMTLKASGYDIVLTTYDALKTREVSTAVDESGRVVQQSESQGGWLTSRMPSSEEEQYQCSVLSRLHFLKWYRLVFVDDLGRQSYLTKPGTARANASSSLKGGSRLIFFEKSSGSTYFFEDKVKESRRQLVPLAKILDVPENRTADKLVGEVMLDFRDVKEEEAEELVSDCESRFSHSS